MKYILVTGGVISGVGKGVIASSIGVLLKGLGLRATAIKIDPYLNIDAGTLTPFDHGEVFVLDDGGEVDLDLGNYERFLDITLSKENNVTTGKIYLGVIERERRGDFLGKTVQVVPHITDAVQDWIERVAHKPVDASRSPADVCIVELGGTVGDIESAPFIEAMRQFQFRVGSENFFLVHVSLVPTIGSPGEQKTKPTQASIRDLRGCGLSPDVIACRSTLPLEMSVAQKIAMFCHVAPQHVLAIHDCSSVYHVPLLLERQGLLGMLQKKLNLPTRNNAQEENYMELWRRLTLSFDRISSEPNPAIVIAVVGKYTNLADSYMSLVKALQHSSLKVEKRIVVRFVEASDLEDDQPKEVSESAWSVLQSAAGILVPGGFGVRGTEGKIRACQYARLQKKPFLGICLGLQLAVIEYARNVLGLTAATSTELDPETSEPLVVFMPEGSKDQMGGTMRVGLRCTVFNRECKAKALYGNRAVIEERHRHRYEVNPAYVDRLEAAGMLFVGRDDSGCRMEVLELPDHPFFIAVQYHPELISKPLQPSPVFLGLVEAASIN